MYTHGVACACNDLTRLRARPCSADAHRCLLEAIVVLDQCLQELACTLHAHLLVERGGAIEDDGAGGAAATAASAVAAAAAAAAAPSSPPPVAAPADVVHDSL
jgi:hypothetical protein